MFNSPKPHNFISQTWDHDESAIILSTKNLKIKKTTFSDFDFNMPDTSTFSIKLLAIIFFTVETVRGAVIWITY